MLQSDQMSSIEIHLQSTDSLRPNDELVRQILARRDELTDFLHAEDPEVESIDVEPEAGFPTGLELFAITVVFTFGKAFIEGFAEGAGKEAGKAIGEEMGKRLGARIRLWIQKEFPDVIVEEGEDSPKS